MNMSCRKSGQVLLIAAALAMTVIHPLPARAQTGAAQPAVLSLNGIGEISVRPDTATVSSGVVSEAATAREALSANSQSMQAVINAMKSAGIAAKDIQTSGFSVQPQYVYPDRSKGGVQEPPRIVSYQVSNMVAVRVRDLTKLGAILDQIVTVGANQIQGISFSLDDDTQVRDDARKAAVKDATRKAELYAEAAGVTLVRVLSIGESGGFTQPPMQYGGMAMKAEAAPNVPVEAGEQTIRAEVSISWEIKSK